MSSTLLDHDVSDDTITPSIKPLLVELFTEELPPKALSKLGQAFAKGMHDGLAAHGLLDTVCQSFTFATPRRLAAVSYTHLTLPTKRIV